MAPSSPACWSIRCRTAPASPADQSYLEALRQVTREVGALLVFDEVITFRVGYRGAQGVWNIDPI